MRFSIIGTGNIAWFLSQKFTQAGHQCSLVYGRDLQAAKELAGTINSSGTDRIRDIKDEDDAIVIAVSDNAIAEIAGSVSIDKALLIHTAGAMGTEVLSQSPKHAVMWPVYSIIRNNFPSHRNIPCAYEANTTLGKTMVRNLIHAFTDLPFEAGLEKRQWLHLGAVFGNNFINHLMAICETICKDQDIPFSMLRPILQQTMNRIQDESPAAQQTGPAIRGDDSTIARHTSLLQSHHQWQQVYKAITESIGQTYPLKKTETLVKD